MQKIAAYLLERRDGCGSTEVRLQEASRLKDEVLSWLREKGGTPGESGNYSPEDGSTGEFSTVNAIDGSDTWWMLQLQEDTDQGRQTRVSISVTAAQNSVAVYLTMEVGWSRSSVQPIYFDPRCPRIIRTLLALPGRFYHGTTELRAKTQVSGFEEGLALSGQLLLPTRTIPIVVVSQDYGGLAFPNIDERIEHSLAGLANVVVVDEDAAWALTDALGKRLSCYNGAIRVYWPGLSPDGDPFRYPLWTADRIKISTESSATCEPVLRKLRHLVFSASALSVIRPADVERIRNAYERRTHEANRQNATSAEEFQALADSYAEENDKLRTERSQLESENDQLRLQLAKSEGECIALKAHLDAKDAKSRESSDQSGLGPDTTDDESSTAPQSGETRYYKKIGSTPSHDVLKLTQDCGCNRWQNSHGADKARKGLQKLEGRGDFKSMQHCGSCTGGGMWKVRW